MVSDALNLPCGDYTEAAIEKRDSFRAYTGDTAASEKQKRIRKARVQKHAENESKAKKKEGKTYGAAAFAGLDSDISSSDSD